MFKKETRADRALWLVKFTLYFAWFYVDFVKWVLYSGKDFEEKVYYALASWALVAFVWFPLFARIKYGIM